MRRTLLALAVVAILSLAAAIPASAASYLQFRINPSSGTWSQTPAFWIDLPVDFKSTRIGLTGFLQVPSSPWGLRYNLDTGSLTNLTGPLVFYDGGNWRYSDISLGYQLNVGRGTGVVFAGYGTHRAEWNIAGVPESRQDVRGLVLGADVFYPINPNWYVTGTIAYGRNMPFEYSNAPFTPLRAEGRATSSVYGAGIGFRPAGGAASVEAGWRSGGFTVNSITTGDAGANNQNLRWSGWYVGVKVGGP